MFSSLGLFKHIPCPKKTECDLHACIFAHDERSQHDTPEVQEYDPFGTSYGSPHPAKRLKAAHGTLHVDVSPQPISLLAAQRKEELTSRELPNEPHPAHQKPPNSSAPPAVLTADSPPKTAQPALKSQKPTTATRPISPPPAKSKSQVISKNQPPPKKEAPKKEALFPRNVPSAPVQFNKRQDILKRFHKEVSDKDKKVGSENPKWKPLMLDEQELIKFTLDREEDAARKYDGNIYQSHLGNQMVKFRKMSAAEWQSFVRETIRQEEVEPPKPTDEPPKRPSTGLDSLEEEVAILRAIRTSLAGLENFGYVTSPPTAQGITAAQAAADASAGYEECDRCRSRFRVFPGRDDEGKLTTGGACRYHWARANRSPSQRIDRGTGGGQVSHPCCSQVIGSQGCTEAETHVFNVKDPNRLAGILQFEATPLNPSAVKTPVSFDCEMGYTTLGLEVIRVTAVSWPEGKQLLDVLVRPYGEILDFNTRFSGVTQKQYVNAVPYGEDTEGEPEHLQKVESPAAARKLLLKLVGPETPLIGHAIDNDLNTLRIIHPLVVDTVLLYPHPKGLPVRYGLKVLTRQHLDRSIQASGADGHDSKEDAIATGNLVTLKVAEKWKKMKAAGWKFEEGKLAVPESKAPKAFL